MHVRGIHQDIPFLFNKDKALIDLANKHQLSFIGLSFVRHGTDIREAKALIDKNIQIIGDKPMIQFTMDAALNAECLDSFILSSDDDNAINLAKELGVNIPFKRPNNLCLDSSSLIDVLDHALKWYEINYNMLPENIILLQQSNFYETQKASLSLI